MSLCSVYLALFFLFCVSSLLSWYTFGNFFLMTMHLNYYVKIIRHSDETPKLAEVALPKVKKLPPLYWVLNLCSL